MLKINTGKICNKCHGNIIRVLLNSGYTYGYCKCSQYHKSHYHRTIQEKLNLENLPPIEKTGRIYKYGQTTLT